MPALEDITWLGYGTHEDAEDGVCLLEAVAYVSGEHHTDQPSCTSPLLAELGRRINDNVTDDARQELIKLIPAFIGTADDGLEDARAYKLLDILLREWMSKWLEAGGLPELGARFRDHDPIVDMESAAQFQLLATKAVDEAGKKFEAGEYSYFRHSYFMRNSVVAFVLGSLKHRSQVFDHLTHALDKVFALLFAKCDAVEHDSAVALLDDVQSDAIKLLERVSNVRPAA